MTTRERVRELVALEPQLNRTEIAARLGVSRERVRQIVVSEGLAVARGVRGVAPRPPRPPESRAVTGGVPARITHTIAGTIGELLAAADLMTRGYVVFFPLIRSAACDLITLGRSGEVERIEVRCGYRSKGRIVWNCPDKSKSDRRAIVLVGEPVHYEPPLG